jgi:cytochrome c biogenesis protein
LLAGVIWTSLTGFSGFKPVLPGEIFQFDNAEHSKMWIGKLPTWSASVIETHREDYPSGEAKQWYSTIVVKDRTGKLVKEQTISVNNPLSYDGVDIYQSSWALKALKVRFGNELRTLSLQPMGKLFAAFLPLPDDAVLIFSVRDAQSPLRIFAKRKDWPAPKLLTQILLNKTTHLGNVPIAYEGTIAQTGLQYKCDPGLPIVFVAFVFIIGGISLAAVPHRQIWVQLNKDDSDNTYVTIGGTTKKGKISFARQLAKLAEKLQQVST